MAISKIQCENYFMAPVKKPKQVLQRTFLREWREHEKLTQESAAAKLNVSRTLLSKVENASSPYTQQLLENAAVLYKCSIPALIARDPRDEASVWRIHERITKVSEQRRRDILRILDTLLQAEGV